MELHASEIKRSLRAHHPKQHPNTPFPIIPSINAWSSPPSTHAHVISCPQSKQSSSIPKHIITATIIHSTKLYPSYIYAYQWNENIWSCGIIMQQWTARCGISRKSKDARGDRDLQLQECDASINRYIKQYNVIILTFTAIATLILLCFGHILNSCHPARNHTLWTSIHGHGTCFFSFVNIHPDHNLSTLLIILITQSDSFIQPKLTYLACHVDRGIRFTDCFPLYPTCCHWSEDGAAIFQHHINACKAIVKMMNLMKGWWH